MSPSACFCPRRNKGCKSNREEPPPASRLGGSASQDRGLRDQSPGVRPKGPSRRLRQHPSPLRLPLGCSAGKQPEMPLAGERTPPKRGVGAARGVADAQREQRAAMAGRSRTRTRAPPTPRPSFLTTGRARWEQVARSWAWLGLPGLEGSSWGSPPPAFSSPPPPALFAEGPSLWAVTAASPRGSKGAAASGHPRRVSTAAESGETSLVPGLRASKQARRGSPQSRPTPAAGSQRARQPEGGGCAEKGVLSLGPQHPGAPSPPAPSQPDAGAARGLAGPLPSDRKGSSGPLAAPVETGSKWCQR